MVAKGHLGNPSNVAPFFLFSAPVFWPILFVYTYASNICIF